MVIRDRDRWYAIAFTIALVVLCVLATIWIATNVFGAVLCPCLTAPTA